MTLQEKAQAQAKKAHTNILNHIANNTLSIDLIDKGFEECYIAGAKESLAGQWHDAKTDPPPFGERIICATLDVHNEIKYLRVGERIGEDNYRDWEDEYSYIGCDIWMYAPEPPKPSDQ